MGSGKETGVLDGTEGGLREPQAAEPLGSLKMSEWVRLLASHGDGPCDEQLLEFRTPRSV